MNSNLQSLTIIASFSFLTRDYMKNLTINSRVTLRVEQIGPFTLAPNLGSPLQLLYELERWSCKESAPGQKN